MAGILDSRMIHSRGSLVASLQVMGRTDTNRLAFFPGGADLIGQIVPVEITEVRAVSLSGRMVAA